VFIRHAHRIVSPFVQWRLATEAREGLELRGNRLGFVECAEVGAVMWEAW
jgi:hypothetical protein